jgi:invasion protein IalB
MAQNNTVSEADLSPGQVYIADTFKDWEVLCIKSGDEIDSCHISQLISDGDGNPTASLSLYRYMEEEGIAAAVTILTPLKTLLTSNLELTIEDQAPVEYPFSWCDQRGCHVRIALTDDDVFSMKKGSKAKIRIESIAAPGEPVVLELSLLGFTKAFAALRYDFE